MFDDSPSPGTFFGLFFELGFCKMCLNDGNFGQFIVGTFEIKLTLNGNSVIAEAFKNPDYVVCPNCPDAAIFHSLDNEPGRVGLIPLI